MVNNHYDDVLAEVSNRYDTITCRNDCGFDVPVGVNNVAGLDCPECGHDNTSPLFEQYLYWRMTKEKSQ
ncbi:hypothetical protein [Halorussus halophilus]|uniref:hypothetical protein n=1 Tax=Halorussus halophilus TaxID=2650975 RepID=UPI001301719E|nr:hypothetical protein [Halorussus halophilus]